jgi:hypothetical protein
MKMPFDRGGSVKRTPGLRRIKRMTGTRILAFILSIGAKIERIVNR